MFAVERPLKTTQDQELELDKRFRTLSRCHNVMVKHVKHLLNILKFDKNYNMWLKEYRKLSHIKRPTEKQKIKRKKLAKRMNLFRGSIGLTESGLQAYIRNWYPRNGRCLQSRAVQKEATRVWKGAEKVIFGNGKDVRFKRFMDFDTIGGKTNAAGIRFDPKTLTVKYNGLDIPIKLPKNAKDRDMLLHDIQGDIRYCEIKRRMFNNGWHYYVVIILKADAHKRLLSHAKLTERGGVDIGTSTVAFTSKEECCLRELAPRSVDYNRKIARIQRQLDRSRRAMNPAKYKEDSTFDQGNKDPWIFSKNYFKLSRRLKTLYRQKSAYIKQDHERVCNLIIQYALCIFIEKMNFAALAKRAKKAKRKQQAEQKKAREQLGMSQTVKKSPRKKRFGRSIQDRAPAGFIRILERKLSQYGGILYYVNTKVFKASQFHHDTGEYIVSSLSERFKDIAGHEVQRDLYSAFLLMNSNTTGTAPDIDLCDRTFSSFLIAHNRQILEMKANGITRRSCFGF